MSTKRIFLFIIFSLYIIQSCLCQEKENAGVRILFRGIIMDAKTLYPISNSQIFINRSFSLVSSTDGTFAFTVNRNDSILFKHLGYKSVLLFVSDTLAGNDFVTGIYMNSDTLSIGEVVIVPKFINLKSEIMNAPSKIPSTMDNARYNMAISGYQGRTTQGKLGDPSANYELLRQRQKVDAYEKGGIPSDKIVGISPLLLIPAAYLLIHRLPEKPAPMEQKLTEQELNQIQKKYLESLNQQK
jgi:hypothetical protein